MTTQPQQKHKKVYNSTTTRQTPFTVEDHVESLKGPEQPLNGL